jgi:DNA repair protein RadA/Sms
MKQKIEFSCSNCGYKSPKWLGKCLSCGQWDTFVEVFRESEKKIKLIQMAKAQTYTLDEIESTDDYRLLTGITELDRVLGGGIVPGSFILVGGDPGIGKSTLLLQMCGKLSAYKPLYVTGEESIRQIKHRSSRLSDVPGDIRILAETNLEVIAESIEQSDSNIVIIDSIQSVFSSKIESTPGSILQVRECSSLLMSIAKKLNKAIFIVGHVTKDGFIAGPKILEHMVDTVLQFEGDKTYSYRILRALKNRYGSTNEIGIFEMNDIGLSEVNNPSELFLSHRSTNDPGVAIVSAIEGSRPILLEVQALVSSTGYSMPQRTVNGIELRRLQMILAVLEKRLGIPFRNFDVFVNVAGGVFLNDPAVDIGIAAALVSSFKDKPISSKFVLIGEIGLTGEIRQVSALQQRLKEAEKLGFKRAYIPKAKIVELNLKDMELITIDRISLALAEIFS